VLGSAKGWAGAIKYNDKARKAIDDFFHKDDTLSIGICNGCQLFMELDLINPEYSDLPGRMHHNDSYKHECQFTSVNIQENHSVMMQDMAGFTLGVWISHGEGKFHLPKGAEDYHIVGKYGYAEYPANPNGSDYNSAFLASKDGRHLVTMPHIERSFHAWNWPHYPDDRNDEVSPWAHAFVNARKWLQERM
jgi:phosphoribosylformylglycinamidine synthase